MKEDQQLERLDQLKRLLPQQPSGRLAEGTASEVESLLIGCWQLLGGFKQESTSADKLFGRMENIRWEPPYVMFQIERHGGTVMGSSRAEIHDWSVNLETATASCSTGRFRQLRPHAAALDVAPLVEKVAQGIDAGESSPDLKWLAPDRVRVKRSDSRRKPPSTVPKRAGRPARVPVYVPFLALAASEVAKMGLHYPSPVPGGK